MTQHVLLEQLQSLLKNMPGLEGRGTYASEQFAWLGKASTLIRKWDSFEAISFNSSTNSMIQNMNRQANYGLIITTIHKAIASIEEGLPKSAGQVFGPGAVYDFFKALRDLVSSAENTLLIVDPYMDAEIFDSYLSASSKVKKVRLLANKHSDDLKTASEKFSTQYSINVQAHKSSQIHDRVIFVDDEQCWVLGASIKDAAAKKPTYLAPLPKDIVAVKLQWYEDIWKNSSPI